MALFINTNIASLTAQRQLNQATNGLESTFERLASGRRINSAKDDAAGLQISNRLTSQINGLEQGNRNANDGISVAQTAEGAFNEITNMFQRVRTLAEQAANGSATGEDRLAVQDEIRTLMEEVNRVAADTTFAGQNILDGSYSGNFQIGSDAVQTISFNMKNVGGTTANTISAAGGFTLSGLASIASAVTGNALTASLDGLSNVTGAHALSGTTANTSVAFSDVFRATHITVSSQGDAQMVMAGMDSLIAVVDKKRAELGGVQNRFESTIRLQSTMAENLTSARSRILDTDFASETAKLAKHQILQQASTSILAQANQSGQAALSLLR